MAVIVLTDCIMTEPLAQVSSNILLINEGPKHLISILFGWDACLN